MGFNDILGGAASYFNNAVGRFADPGPPSDPWQDFSAKLASSQVQPTVPRLAGGGSYGSQMPRLAGGGSYDTGMPRLAGGTYDTGMPRLAGGSVPDAIWNDARNAGVATQQFYSNNQVDPKTGVVSPRQPRAAGGSTGGTTNYGSTGAGGAGAWAATMAPANSPIIPIADQIAAYAISKGVDPALIFGKLQAESSWATNGQGPQLNNPGNIMAPGSDPANGHIILRQYGSMLEGVQAMVDLLASYNEQYAAMFGKPRLSLEDMVAIYYVGPEAYKRYGLQANDAGGYGPGGNGTVQDYLDRNIYPIMKSYNSRPGAVTAPTIGGLEGITPGTQGSIMQEFGPTPYAQEHSGTYEYGGAYGLGPGQHPGVDWAVPIGTQVATAAGGTVYVVGNDHGTGYYYRNTMTQTDPDHSGEFAVMLDNGDILILGHLASINVNVGQRVNAGQIIGLSGGSDGAHVHVEYRRRNPDGSYTIVDPRTVLGNYGAPPPSAPGSRS